MEKPAHAALSDSSPKPDVGAAGSPRAEALGQRVGSGLLWAVVSNGLSKSAGLVLLVGLGYLLKPEQMGVWIATMGVYGLMLAVRDAGLGTLLVQRGESQYAALVGPVFWLTMTIHLAGALVLAGIAPLLATAQPDKVGLLGTLLLCAVALSLMAPSSVAMARLRMQMRFARISLVAVCSAMVRVVVVLACAWRGLGPYSFALGLIAVAIVETIALSWSTGERLWAHPARVATWPGLLYQTRWNSALALASALLAFGDSLLLMPFVSAAVLGIYGFAVQLVMQAEQALSGSASQVLFPTFSQFKDDTQRLGQAMVRACRALVLVGAPLTLGLGALADPLVKLVWPHGRWNEAIACVSVLSIFFVFRITFVAPGAVLLAQGRFKRTFAAVMSVGVALPLAAGIAGHVVGTPLGVSIVAGSVFGPACLLASLWCAASVGVGWGRMLSALLPAWILAFGCAGGVWGLDRWLVALALPAGDAQARVHNLLRLVAGGTLFVVMYTGLVRLLLAHAVNDALQVAPARLAGLVRRVLFLRGPGPA